MRAIKASFSFLVFALIAPPMVLVMLVFAHGFVERHVFSMLYLMNGNEGDS